MEVGSEDDKQRSRYAVTVMCIWQCLRVCDGDGDGDDHLLDIKRAAVAKGLTFLPSARSYVQICCSFCAR